MKEFLHFFLFTVLFSTSTSVEAVASETNSPPIKPSIISIEGEITEEGKSLILGKLLECAVSKPDVVVIYINSSGGSVSDVLEIVSKLQKLDSESWAYVLEATSSSIFLMAACDRIVMDDRAIVGGAGCLSRDYEVFDEEIFSAITSFFVRKLREITTMSRQDFEVFRAMVDHEMEFMRNERVWKRPLEILSLTSSECTELELSEGSYSSFHEFLKTFD